MKDEEINPPEELHMKMGSVFNEYFVGPPPGDREERPPSMQYMTLLDYFAGQVMTHVLSISEDGDAVECAPFAYGVASCLLKEREKWDHRTGERKDDA